MLDALDGIEAGEALLGGIVTGAAAATGAYAVRSMKKANLTGARASPQC